MAETRGAGDHQSIDLLLRARGRSMREAIAHVGREGRHLRASVLLAVGVGAVTGIGVAGLHEVIQNVSWFRFSISNAWWIVLLPVGGLIASSIFVRLSPDRSRETTEDYIRVFHDPKSRMSLRSAPFRLLAAVSTIALGGSMGLEGPSIYLGAVIGDTAERWMPTLFEPDQSRVMLVAGAAAGIAAIFKAPLTGIVFALEVPYRDDLARRALIPAMFAAATSYVVFVSIAGTAPIFPILAAPLRLADLGGSLLIGVGCGLGARVFIALHRASTKASRRIPDAVRPLVFGVVLAGLGALSLVTFHLPLVLGPGYNGILRAARGQIAPGLLVALFAMKMVATSSTVAGNGVGGLFFPAVMMGATVGGALGHVVPGPSSLFAVVGIAAFLGGAYKVPLAGVAFVAETTGAPGYIIPGLLAAALGYLASGRGSLSHRQRSRVSITRAESADAVSGSGATP